MVQHLQHPKTRQRHDSRHHSQPHSHAAGPRLRSSGWTRTTSKKTQIHPFEKNNSNQRRFQYGLYSAFVGCFVYIIFGTCKDITIGPTALMALMTYQQVDGRNTDYAVLLCFMTGIVQLLMSVLNLGERRLPVSIKHLPPFLFQDACRSRCVGGFHIDTGNGWIHLSHVGDHSRLPVQRSAWTQILVRRFPGHPDQGGAERPQGAGIRLPA